MCVGHFRSIPISRRSQCPSACLKGARADLLDRESSASWTSDDKFDSETGHVKALQAELGKERANALVRKALGDVYRRLGEQWWRANESTHVGENMALAFACSPKVTPLNTVSARSRKIPMRSMSLNAGTHSSTRSWVSLS